MISWVVPKFCHWKWMSRRKIFHHQCSDWELYESFDNIEFTSDEDNNSKVIRSIKFESPQINYDADDSSPPSQGCPIMRNHCPYSRRQSSCSNRVKCTSLPEDTNIRKPRGRGHGRGPWMSTKCKRWNQITFTWISISLVIW